MEIYISILAVYLVCSAISASIVYAYFKHKIAIYRNQPNDGRIPALIESDIELIKIDATGAMGLALIFPPAPLLLWLMGHMWEFIHSMF